MKINFECHSLLYGISCMWLLIQIFMPYFIWPNFARTESDHILKSTPRLLTRLDSIGKRTRAVYWMPRLAMSIMVGLAVALLYVTNYLQPFFLKTIGVNEATKLSFKFMSHTPMCTVSNQNKTPLDGPLDSV